MRRSGPPSGSFEQRTDSYSPPPLILLDTNVLIRLGDGRVAAPQLVNRLFNGQVRLLLVKYVLREFCGVLADQARLDTTAHLNRIAMLLAHGMMMGNVVASRWEPAREDVVANLSCLTDQKDVPILLSARKFEASAIITYNVKHFREQKEFPVFTPEEYCSTHS